MTAGPTQAPEPGARQARAARAARAAGVVALALVAVGFLVHLQVVRAHAVDLPYADEWDLLAPDGLPQGLTAGWLLGLHNEHRIAPTKLQAWALLRLCGLDNVAFVTTSALLFGGVLLTLLAWLVRRGLPPLAAGAFGLLLLSPIAFQNHAWGFQSQVHLALLTLVLGAAGLFAPTGRARAGGALALIVGAYSFSAGVPYALAAVSAFVLQRGEVARARLQAGDAAGAGRARLDAALVAAPCVLALGLWTIGWERGDLGPTWPWTARWWDVWLNLVSLGFGFQARSAALGLACLLVVALPPALLVRRDPACPRAWELAALTGALLLGLAAIAVARGGWGPDYAKTSRYAELALPLAPLAALGWWRLLGARPRARAASVALVGALACLGLADDWSLAGYRRVERHKRAALARIAAHRGGRLRCPDVYPGWLQERLEAARALQLSFTRGAGGSGAPPGGPDPTRR